MYDIETIIKADYVKKVCVVKYLLIIHTILQWVEPMEINGPYDPNCNKLSTKTTTKKNKFF